MVDALNSSDLETQIVKALEDYFKIIELQKQGDSILDSPLRLHFGLLDQLTAQLSAQSNPQLHHFMMRKSYQKALEFIRQKKKITSHCSSTMGVVTR